MIHYVGYNGVLGLIMDFYDGLSPLARRFYQGKSWVLDSFAVWRWRENEYFGGGVACFLFHCMLLVLVLLFNSRVSPVSTIFCVPCVVFALYQCTRQPDQLYHAMKSMCA